MGHSSARGGGNLMKINERELLNLFNQKTWQVPLFIAILATPFMVLTITTKDDGLITLAMLALLLLLLVFLAYNLLHRYLRKKFQGDQRN